MALSLWIPPALQYGVVAPGEARTNAYQRAVEQALKQHLFKDQDAGAHTAAASPYVDGLRQFNAALTSPPSFGRDRQSAARLWQALLASDTPQEHPEASVQERIEGLFCLALHCLCAALAKQTVRQNSTDTSDEDEDEDADEDNMDEDIRPGVEYAETVRVLAEQLRRLAARWLRSQPEHERPENDDWNLVARLLLEPLLAAFKAQFVVRTLDQKRQRDGRPHTEKRIEIAQPELAQRIERLLETLPLSFSPQPLRHPPAYYLDDPGPSNDEADMCIRVDLIGYRQTNAFLRTVHHDLQCPEHRPPAFGRYVEAINLQQAVPWRVNRDLLHWTRALINTLDTAANGHDEQAPLRDWVRNGLYRPRQERPRNPFGSKRDHEALRARSGEFLDNPLARRALDELCPSDGADPPAFYLPWKADYRGRIYAETPWLTPQGGDLQRALLEFARGQVLTDAGASALRRHGANLVSRKRLLDDLGILDRQVVTLEERERWVLDHEADILASAADPLAQPFWREVADEPMQFLAFCLAYRKWKEHPEAPIHLPVQIDGTCNGLQHIAALTGDAELARAVNVLPRADGLPGDIYSELAERARATLGQVPVSKGQAVHRDGLTLADAWLAADPARRAWLDRKTAKKVVMTIPYGASRSAQAHAVLEAIEGRFMKAWHARRPSESELDALWKWRSASQARRDFVRTCTKGLFVEARQTAFPKKDENSSISIRVYKPEPKGKASGKTRAKPDNEESWSPERTEWERLRTLGAYVALALVEHLHGALDRNYPGVRRFADWLGQTAKACAGTEKEAGLPLPWLTPLGFPVVQDKFAPKETSVTVQLGAQSIKLDVRRLTEDVEPVKQRDALLPNLIHSLDATHLMLTLLVANKRGVRDIGSIHDCLLCHPNQAETLARTVREAFAYLYAPDSETGLPKPLNAWHEWMKRVVELRMLPCRGKVKVALDHPGALGEVHLEQEANSGQQEAADARDWLARFREHTPPPERFLLGLLLERAATLLTPSPQPRLTKPPIADDAPALSEATMSPYFFS